MTTTGTRPGDMARILLDLARSRERMAEASSSAEELRSLLGRISTEEDALQQDRERLPTTAGAVELARSRERELGRLNTRTLGYLVRGRLTVERERRAAALRTALGEQRNVDSMIAQREERLVELRAQAAQLRPRAVALPRLLDETAGHLHQLGGPAAGELQVAEAGLEPASRREADLDKAIRWVGWAVQQINRSMQRLGNGRTYTEYDGYLHGAAGSSVDETATRLRRAQEALSGVREVLDTVTGALNELGVQVEGLEPAGLPADVDDWFAGMTDPHGPVAEQIIQALAEAELIPGVLSSIQTRLRHDHIATLRVVQERRARWCAILRGSEPGPQSTVSDFGPEDGVG